MKTQRIWGVIFAVGLLIAFQLYGLAELSKVELPNATLMGVLYSKHTLKPLPNILIEITDERYWETWEPTNRKQGWLERQYQSPARWQVYTDAQGRFQVRGIPPGTYRVQCNAKVHTLSTDAGQYDWMGQQISLKAGETLTREFWAHPRYEFLDAIHPQAVYTPEEPLKLGLRGFLKEDQLQLRLHSFQIDPSDPRVSEVLERTQGLRYGWWETSSEWERVRNSLKPHLKFSLERTYAVRGRDPEGVFIQYIDLPRLEEGTYLAEVRSASFVRPMLLMVSSVGLVMKSAPDANEVWCVDLRTGQPVADVPLSLVKRGRNPNENSLLIGQARSNSNGVARFETAEGYLVAQNPRTGRIVGWVESSSGWEVSSEEPEGVLYTERPIYRPGQTIHFKGIFRKKSPEGYSLLPVGTSIRIEVRDPDYETVFEREYTLNAFSSLSGEFTVDPDAPTGFYTISAYHENRYIGEHYAPVSAYRKPTMRVEARPSSELYMPNQTIDLEIRTEYYFGMPVSNTELSVRILRQPTWYGDRFWTAEDEEDWYSDFEDGFSADDYGTLVYYQDARTDAQGRLRLRIPARRLLDEVPTGTTAPIVFVVKVDALSEGRESAKGETQFQIAPGAWRIAFEEGQWFGEVGRPYTYTVRVTEIGTGKPVQTNLRWTVGQPLWQGQTQRFQQRASSTVRTDAEGYATLQFTPEQPGDWVLQIEATDPNNRALREETTVWVTTSNWWSDQYASARGVLEVRPSKRTYAPGENAEIAIRSSQRDAVFYVTLEGDKLYRSKVVRSQGAVTRVSLPLTAEQTPSAVMSVCMVHNKRMYQRTVPLRVGWTQGALQIAVRTDKARYQPRETVQVELRTTDGEGKPTRAELSLAVVDESIYAIREDNPNRLSQAFYSRRPNRVRTEFSAPWLALQGDKGSTETPRRNFPDTAVWLPNIITDEQGVARVQFRLPDSLTEWRLTVNGHTARTQVGYARASIKTSKDLMVRLRLPMWLVEGDKAELSAIVSNETDQPRTVQVELRTPEGRLPAQVNVPARGSQIVRWNYEAKTVGTLTFTVFARAEGTNLTDSEQRTLEVKPSAVFESTTIARLVQGEQTLPFTVAQDARIEHSRLELRTYPNLLSLLEEPVDYLLDYDHLCAEQTTSKFLPPLMWLRAQESLGIAVPDEKRERIAQSVRMGIQRLSELRHDEDGWTWMGDGDWSLWLTAYVMTGLHHARLAGFEVPDRMYEGGLDILRKATRNRLNRLHEVPDERINPYEFRYLLRETAYGLRTLAELGDTPDKVTPELTRLWNPLLNANDLPTRVDVLIALLHWKDALPAEQAISALWNRLLRNRNETASTLQWASSEESATYWEWGSQEIQSLCLKALVLSEPQAVKRFGSRARYQELLDKTAFTLIVWLMDNRRYSSRDVALAVQALLDYSRVRGVEWGTSASQSLEVAVNAQGATRVNLPTDSFAPASLNLTSALQRGENRVRLRTEGGSQFVVVRIVQARPLSAHPRERTVQVRLFALDPRRNNARPIRPNDTVPVGTLIRVEAEVRPAQSMNWLHYSVLELPYAGGTAPLDTEYFLRWAWWSDNTSQLRDDRALAYREYWYRGEPYRFSFILRAEIPGDYTLLPAQVWGMYSDYEGYSEPLRLRIRDR